MTAFVRLLCGSVTTHAAGRPEAGRERCRWHNAGVSVRILVLDDDDGIRASLALAMSGEGYQPVPAPSAEEALAEVRTRPVDLMLVDLMLGAMDGFTFIREARQVSDAPIIVVSARSDTHDIVAALEAGADDYVTKPFEVKEVSARLRALQRRPPAVAREPEGAAERLVLDSRTALVLDMGAGQVRRAEEPVHLTMTEFRLLCEFSRPPGRVISRRSLLERVWDHGYFGDERIVDVHIRRLRTKIETEPSRPELLVTVRGLGYRLDTR
jgi:DNA-binding response OmpR family regulator